MKALAALVAIVALASLSGCCCYCYTFGDPSSFAAPQIAAVAPAEIPAVAPATVVNVRY